MLLENFYVQTGLGHNMQDFSKVEVLSVSAKICDRCNRRGELNDSEFHEFLTIDRIVGFGSIFGDGECIRLDLCQHCMRDLLGLWVRIKTDKAASAAGESELEAAHMEARDALASPRVMVSPEVVDQLDMPPQTNEALRKTMLSQSPWED